MGCLSSYGSLLDFVRSHFSRANNYDQDRISKSFYLAHQITGYELMIHIPFLRVQEKADGPTDILIPSDILSLWINGLPPKLKFPLKIPQLQNNRPQDYVKVEYWASSRYRDMMDEVNRLLRHNEIIIRGSPLLRHLKNSLTSKKIHRLVAFDFEAFEYDQKHLLELGAAIWEDGCAPVVKHFIFQDSLHFRNGRLCADNRDNFSFGESIVITVHEAIEWLWQELRMPGTALVAHNMPADKRYLTRFKYPAHERLRNPFDYRWFQVNQGRIFDTQAIFKEVNMKSQYDKLETILHHHDIPHSHLHNAGNDAYYTLLVALKMADIPLPQPPTTVGRIMGVQAHRPSEERQPANLAARRSLIDDHCDSFTTKFSKMNLGRRK